MKKLIGFISSVVLLSAALASCSLGSAEDSSNATAKKSGTGIPGYYSLSVSSESELKAVSDLEVNKDYVIAKTVQTFDPAVFSSLGAEVAGSFTLNGAAYWHLKKAGGTVQLVSDLQKTSGVYYAEHELKSYLPENSPNAVAASSVSAALPQAKDAAAIAAVLDDPLTWGAFAHFETTNAIDAYTHFGFGTNTVYVVDIDTGINKTHEDFTDSSGNSIIERAKSAFDGAPGSFVYVGDSSNFVDAGDNWDDQAHGSHTAGTMVAVGNNGKGVAGVCWKNAKLISYKCFANGSSSSGCNWAVYGGFKDLVAWKTANSITQTIPVNMSLGGPFAGSFESEMIAYALNNGMVICASMGNEGQYSPNYPASYAGVIAVGAATSAGQRVPFSCMGKHCSVMGPGYNILSTSNGGSDAYEDMSGTSMSCPFVTGTVAYLLTFNPNLKADQIKAILEETAQDMGTTGFDEETGYGLVDVDAAAKLVKNGTIPDSGSKYSSGALKIAVSASGTAVSGQPVYLYDSAGSYVATSLTNSVDGAAIFYLLPPGNYTAKTAYNGSTKSVPITQGSTGDAFTEIAF